MRVEGRYESQRLAKLALRQWRGLYGDPEADPADRFFRVRYLPDAEPSHPWAVVSFTDREEADAVDAEGELQ